MNRERDQAGIETNYEYDNLSRLVAVVDARGGRTEYTYDAAGNQLTQEDAMGRITRFEYDNMNRRTKRKLPLLQEELYGYDTVGNLNAKTNFNGQLISYTHDLNNRLATKTYPSRAESYLYSPTGRRTKMTINGADTNYGYDLRDRLTSKSSAEGTLGYTYDLHGNLKTVDTLTPNGVRITYHYDVLNRIQSVLDRRTGLSTVYAYDPNGNLESTTLPNNLKTTHTYDPQNRLTLMETVNQTTSTLLKSFAYQLNQSGHRTRLTEGDGRVSRWNYDDLYRLTTETISADPSGINGFVSYIYDNVGNRQSRVSALPGITNQSFSYDDNDRLTTDSYDDNGSTLASGTNTYVYDAETKLTSANVNGHAITMTYDGDGNRISKTVDGTTTTYLVDTNNPTGYSQVFEEKESGTLTKVYFYGLDLIAQDHIGATGYRYFGYDGLGSTRFLSDVIGNISDNYKYDAFGNILDSLSGSSKYLFGGEQLDTDLNLNYLRARLFKSESGRFFSGDHWEGEQREPKSLHKYSFGLNNPINTIDPSGFQGVSTVESPFIIQFLASLFGRRDAKSETKLRSSRNDYQFAGEQAIEAARPFARNALNTIMSIRDKGAPAKYIKWFGKYRPQEGETVYLGFKSVVEALEKKFLFFELKREDMIDPNQTARVIAEGPRAIQLSYRFFELNLIGFNSRAATIIHEVSHIAYITDDFVYGIEDSLKLAMLDPYKATLNADNYKYFAMDGK